MAHPIETLDMESPSNDNTQAAGRYVHDSQSSREMIAILRQPDALGEFLQRMLIPTIDELLMKLTVPAGKKSFLVFKNNKYFNVATENIAFFYIKYEAPMIMCFDKQEYFVDYSLDQIQQLLPANQFFRLNRQYLINFNAVKEVEHYFARKLLVQSVIPAPDKLIVSKEKVTEFLRWLDNR